MNQASGTWRVDISAARQLLSVILLALIGCSTAPDAGDVARGDAGQAQIRVLRDAEVVAGNGSAERRRLIADLLFEGLQALDADRLLTPPENSAHSRFRRVLAYEPNNEIALQGLQDIVVRYTELAEEATQQGLFDQAELMLDRARFVDSSHPAIAEAEDFLSAERQSGDLFFDLEASEVARRTDNLQVQLADIARQARSHEAFFLITAPSDEQARWIYSVMREAVNGYRLRGTIELASRYSIRLRMPESGDS